MKAKQDSATLISGNQEVTNDFTVTAPANGSYAAATNLDFTLKFPYAVTVTGTPRLTLNIGGATRYANYTSGTGTKTLIFRYTVTGADNDTDGIALTGTIGLNGGTLQFTGTAGLDNCNLSITVPSTSAVLVDSTAPTVSSVSAPAASTYLLSMPMVFTATMSEAVTVTGTPRLTLDIGGTTRYATYLSGSGTSTLLFRYTVVAADSDSNGIGLTSPIGLNSGTIKDAAGNAATLTFAPPGTGSILVDGDTPYVSSVTAPNNGTYVFNESVDFTFHFSEPVDVTGTPYVAVTVGVTARQAVYISGSGTSTLIFRYVVNSGDADTDGVTLATSFTYPGGATIRDSGTTDVINLFTAPTTTGVKIGASATAISSFSFSNGSYLYGMDFDLHAIFTAAVTVTGTPRIAITLASGTVYATYVSGSGSTNLLFRYTVDTSDLDTDGIVLASPLQLNSGTIRNSLNQDASLVFTPPTTTGVTVDGAAPTIVSATKPTDGFYTSSSVSLSFTITYSEAVIVTGTPRLVLDVGGITRYANYVSGTGTSTLTFTHTIVSTDLDMDGLALANGGDIQLNGGTMQDSAGNDADVGTVPLTLSGIYLTYSGLIGWWDMNDTGFVTTATCGMSNCASTLTDKSGNSRNFTAAGGVQPVYNASGFGSGNTGYIQFDNATAIMNGSLAINPTKTLFMVFQTESATMTTQDLFYQSGLTVKASVANTGNLNLAVVGTYSLNGSALSGSGSAHAAGMVASTNYILAIQYGGGYNISTPRLGSTNFGGKIAEMLVFSSTLSASEIAAVVAYLNSKHIVY